MAGLFFYGLSIYVILYWVTLAAYVSPIFVLHCDSQVATICTFNWNYSFKLLFRRRQQAISYLNTFPNYTLSWYIAELSLHIALSHNSIRRRYKKPQASYLVSAVKIIRAGALEKKSKKTPESLTVPKLSHSAHSLSLYMEPNYTLS